MHNLRTLWLLVFALLLSTSASALTNQLKGNPSPYLALHGHDPVAWQAWNPETIAMARKQNKLLFVSIGYFSCHWCHVMQRESYRNPQIAAVLNDSFIPVKVDRELMSALDSEMQTFSQRTRNRSGWPLNVFVTAEGYPLFATLYSPPKEFLQIVTGLRERWTQDNAALKALARQAALPASKSKPAGEAKFAPALIAHYRTQLIAEALAQADIFRGGFGAANKFPMTPQLSALLDAYEQDPQPRLGEFLRLTLDQMLNLGLYDHVGGGFFRYTTDPDWQVPHFEKMLYDNAQLALLYLRAAKVLKTPAYRENAYAVLDFMLADLHQDKMRGLMTSTSAIDNKNREGAAYLWDKQALQTLLSANEYALVRRIWGMDAPAAFEFGYLPMYKVEPSQAEQIILSSVNAKLRSARSARGVPKDEKRLTSLNGLALMAFSEAARLQPRYVTAASEIKVFLVQEMWHGNALYKASSKGQYLGAGELEDYAYAAAGLLSYASLTGAEEDFAVARQIAQQGWLRFYENAGWKLQQNSLLARQADEIMIADGAVPSPSGVLIKASWQMADNALRTQALGALNAGYAELDQGVFWNASQVAAMMSLQLPGQPGLK